MNDVTEYVILHMSFGNPSQLCLLVWTYFLRLMLFSVDACLVFIASTEPKISLLRSTMDCKPTEVYNLW